MGKLYGKELKYKGGKGDKVRPMFITKEQYDKNWNRAFKEKKSARKKV